MTPAGVAAAYARADLAELAAWHGPDQAAHRAAERQCFAAFERLVATAVAYADDTRTLDAMDAAMVGEDPDSPCLAYLLERRWSTVEGRGDDAAENALLAWVATHDREHANAAPGGAA